jgi:hypothetical protein
MPPSSTTAPRSLSSHHRHPPTLHQVRTMSSRKHPPHQTSSRSGPGDGVQDANLATRLPAIAARHQARTHTRSTWSKIQTLLSRTSAFQRRLRETWEET